MKIKLEANIEFDREQLMTAISNALFFEYTRGNRKKISEMDLYNLAEYIPEIIADMIIEEANDILIIK